MRCRTCGRDLPESAYKWRDEARGWRMTECRECFNARLRRNRERRVGELREREQPSAPPIDFGGRTIAERMRARREVEVFG